MPGAGRPAWAGSGDPAPDAGARTGRKSMHGRGGAGILFGVRAGGDMEEAVRIYGKDT